MLNRFVFFCLIIDFKNAFSCRREENESSAVHDVTGTVSNITTKCATYCTKSFKQISFPENCMTSKIDDKLIFFAFAISNNKLRCDSRFFFYRNLTHKIQ